MPNLPAAIEFWQQSSPAARRVMSSSAAVSREWIGIDQRVSRAKSRLQRPAAIAAGLFALEFLAVLTAIWCVTGHHFVYPLDDTYIGMSIARNLALHGVWGVTPYAFNSASSSLIFPLLIAGTYRILGPSPWPALVLSAVFAVFSILVAARMLARYLTPAWRTLVLILFVLLTPLTVIGVLGMEHSLHLLLTLLFLDYFMERPAPAGTSQKLWPIVIITALMVSARYEGLFFAVPAVCILLLQCRWKAAAAISIGAAVPVLGYAVYSIAHGGAWLPNSVATKGVHLRGSLFSWLQPLLHNAVANYRDFGATLTFLLAGVGAFALALLLRRCRAAIPLVLLFCAGCLHLATDHIGTLFRYEDYLVGSAIVCLGCVFPSLIKAGCKVPFFAGYVLILVAGGMLIIHGIGLTWWLPACSRNNYLQQMQMARFLHQNYPQGVVAANDIGAITWFNPDLRCYDLVGLANTGIFYARRKGAYTTAFLEQDTAARHVQIAILYDQWFPHPGDVGGPPLPPEWRRIERWEIPDHELLGNNIVSFYAVAPSQAQPLRQDLAKFDPTLPKEVTVLPN